MTARLRLGQQMDGYVAFIRNVIVARNGLSRDGVLGMFSESGAVRPPTDRGVYERCVSFSAGDVGPLALPITTSRGDVVAFAANGSDVYGLPQIDVPTLLLYGDADRRSPLTVAEDLHAKIPASTLVVLPGVGHQGNLETPERFDAEVRGFLRQVQT